MCTLKDAYFHSYSMVFTNDWSFLDKATGRHSALMTFFAFMIGILLLNIIIALISNVFTQVEQNGQRAFWLKRLRFVNEMQALRDFAQCRVGCKGLANEVDSSENITSNSESLSLLPGCSIRNLRESSFNGWYAYEAVNNDENSSSPPPPPPLSKRLKEFLTGSEYKNILLPSLTFRKILIGVRREEEIKGFCPKCLGWLGNMLFIISVIIPLLPFVLLLGFFTGGYCWPRGMKEYLFFGAIESVPLPPVEKQDDESDAIQSKDSELNEIEEEFKKTQEQLNEIKEESKRTQKQLAELIALVETKCT